MNPTFKQKKQQIKITQMLTNYEDLEKQQLAEMPSAMNADEYANLDEEIEQLFKTQDIIFTECLGKEYAQKVNE